MGDSFYHTTVLLNEAVDGLNINPDGVYVDATFGGGGHSRAILKKLGKKGRLIAFDQDKDAWQNQPGDARLIPVKENFRYLKKFLRLHGFSNINGILADLGVSSWHFDAAHRGFSTRWDGPLDMRMDNRLDKTAADIVNNYSANQLQEVFSQYGEVRNAKQLAQIIIEQRKGHHIDSTETFKTLITPVLKGLPHKYFAQVFQALRIEVNAELDVLETLLQQSAEVLDIGGRLSIITFHSLEDRIVKQHIKNDIAESHQDIMKGYVIIKRWKPIHSKPIEPSVEEQKLNPRARSARLRIAEKIK